VSNLDGGLRLGHGERSKTLAAPGFPGAAPGP
jgi:hypothetical protein